MERTYTHFQAKNIKKLPPNANLVAVFFMGSLFTNQNPMVLWLFPDHDFSAFTTCFSNDVQEINTFFLKT
jgi:hypothetical protein